jgi:hypothetical protein
VRRCEARADEWKRLVGVLCLLATAAAELRAQEPAAPKREGYIPFEDLAALSLPPEERAARLQVQELGGFAAVRTSLASAQDDSRRSGLNVVAAFSLETWQWRFAPRALSLGSFEHLAMTAALGYGYQLGAAWEAGALLTSDSAGSGVLLGIGGQGEGRSLGRAPFASWWGHALLGYSQRWHQVGLQLAILPSVGGMSAARAGVDSSDPLWLRERLRARWRHVELDLELGERAPTGMAAGYWRAELCSSAGRLLLCTAAQRFARTPELVPVSEVSVSVGFGSAQETELDAPPSALRVRD